MLQEVMGVCVRAGIQEGSTSSDALPPVRELCSENQKSKKIHPAASHRT